MRSHLFTRVVPLRRKRVITLLLRFSSLISAAHARKATQELHVFQVTAVAALSDRWNGAGTGQLYHSMI